MSNNLKTLKDVAKITTGTLIFGASFLLASCYNVQTINTLHSQPSAYYEPKKSETNIIKISASLKSDNTHTDAKEIFEHISDNLEEELNLSLEDRIKPKQHYIDEGYVVRGFGDKIPGGIALTIDDCGASMYALKLIEEDNKLRAEMGLPPNHVTFLPIAKYYNNENVVEIYKHALDQGHAFANHTYSHPLLRRASNERIIEEIISSQEIFNETFGYDLLPILRPPGGNWDGRVCEIAKDCGIEKIVMWNRSFADCATDPDGNPVDSSYCIRYIAGVKEGDNVLCHWRANSIGAMPYFLDLLRQRGLTSYTLADYFDIQWPSEKEQDTSYGAFPFNLLAIE
jgi:peptidoglycan-N-acetylglucosamine deacetylase